MRHQDIIGLPVITKNGTRLGRVVSIEINIDTQEIFNYLVKESRWTGAKEFIISRNQVLSINKDKIVVDENLSVEKEEFKKNIPALQLSNTTQCTTK